MTERTTSDPATDRTIARDRTIERDAAVDADQTLVREREVAPDAPQEQPTTEAAPRTRRSWGIALGVAAAILVVLTLAWPALRSGLSGLPLWPTPDPYSEVYFTQPQALPEEYGPDGRVELPFTVGNSEHVASDYEWVAVVREESGSQIEVDRGNFRLEDGQRREVTAAFNVAPEGGPVQVTIDVTHRPEAEPVEVLTLTRRLEQGT